MKRNVPGICVLAALAIGAHCAARAAYPERAIEIIVPAAAGGSTDLGARTFAKYAQKKLGKPVVIINIKGAGGYTGTKAVQEAKPDGHKVLYFHLAVVTNKLAGTAPYSYEAFEMGPTLVEDGSLSLFTGGKSGIRTPKDLIEKAKENPGKLKAATEYGAFTHFMWLKLQKELGVMFKLVDVGSDAEKVTALLGGFVDIMPKLYMGTQAYVDSGDFIDLGVVQAKRVENAPNVPTFKEQGINFEYPPYPFTLFFPKGTPKETMDKFNAVVKDVASDPGFKADIARIGMAVSYKSPEDATKTFAQAMAEFGELAKGKAEFGK